MKVKAYVAAALEDLVGEYVLNISKENIKLAALSGKIKLEDVELDGDFIGSHILGAVGLSGFGVLSCWARTLQINFSWTNLNAPTSLEIREMHLVCVPLLPTTANRMYYGSQSLRTRAKRSALARLERNFFSGRIPGDGPHQEVHQDDDQAWSYNGRRQTWTSPGDAESCYGESPTSSVADENAVEMTFPNSLHQAGEHESTSSSKKEKESGGLPALKQRVKAKIYENLVFAVTGIHIRCEIPEGGLNMSLPREGDGMRDDVSPPPAKRDNSDQRAFAFGLTMASLSVNNVSPDNNNRCETTLAPAREDSGGSSVSDGDSKTDKKVEVEQFSIYWDDDPTFLISESNLLNGLLPVPVETCQRRVAAAMKQMSTRQTPTPDVIASLKQLSASPRSTPVRRERSLGHDYICSNFSLSILTTSTSDISGDSIRFAEIPPCTLDLNITSQQYRTLQLLKDAVLSQQRFDTMLHRRPQKSPVEDPRSWWDYAIACVKHTPTSRSWKDVRRIVQCRDIYLDLVNKNLSHVEKGGFHGGLTNDESDTLAELEDLLPIETLLSFHLVALRRVYSKRTRGSQRISTRPSTRRSNRGLSKKRSSSALGRLMNSISGSTTPWQSLEDECQEEVPMFPSPSDLNNGDPVTLRIKGKPSTTRAKLPTTQTTVQLQGCKVKIGLFNANRKRRIVTVDIVVEGSSYISGSGKADLTFDVTKFEVFDFVAHDEASLPGRKVMAISPDNKHDSVKSGSDILEIDEYEEVQVRLPPRGVVCRAAVSLDQFAVSLDLFAHPATVIWSKTCVDAVVSFFSSSSTSSFISQLRNAATPVAHRAQMAIFSPTSLSISVMVHAPKLWIPISQHMLDGALFLDAGKLKMVLKKAESSPKSDWSMDVQDIQIMLAGETCGTVLDGKENDAIDLDGVTRLGKELTPIVHPFQIDVTGNQTMGSFVQEQVDISPNTPSPDALNDTQESGRISVNISAIRLNLVDVGEELAKALGRYYASGVGMIKNKYASEAVNLHPSPQHLEPTAFGIIHICFDKLEVALECASKREYLVEIHEIKLDKKNKGNIAFTRLSIFGFTIAQLVDANCDQPCDSDVSRGSGHRRTRNLTPSAEPQHQLLARKKEIQVVDDINVSKHSPDIRPSSAPQTPIRQDRSSQIPLRTPQQLRLVTSTLVTSPGSRGAGFIKGCYFHDGENHIDEVEFDVESAIVKVTPTSISDCTIWVTRAMELIGIGSKEMERRVHDRGRRARTREKKKESRDSSIIFRATFKEAAILIGRPASEFTCSRGRKPTDYVIQILTSASVMSQSIENANSTGSRTFHISMNDFSARTSGFLHVEFSEEALLLYPTAIDCRVVYDTVGEGHVTSQDFSFHNEKLHWHLAPHDLRVISSIARKVTERLNILPTAQGSEGEKRGGSDKSNRTSLLSLLRSKKRGSRIATKIRAELHSCSIIWVRPFKSHIVMRPFIEFSVSQLKVCLEGCIDAMNGEAVMMIGVKCFNPNSGWEDVVQSNQIVVSVDQIPNEVAFLVSIRDVIDANLTQRVIEEISDLDRTNRSIYPDGSKRFAKKQQTIFTLDFTNETGIDVVIGMGNQHEENYALDVEHDKGNVHLSVASGEVVSLDSVFASGLNDSCTILSLGASGRQTIHKLPVVPSSTSKQRSLLYKWRPSSNWGENDGIEPVVEFVMQNQRLRPDISDISSLDRGQDLLSSIAWSPVSALTSDVSSNDELWLPPYLQDDPPGWSDMANIVGLNKSEIVLPDTNWMWADTWDIDINGDLAANDQDGWEYSKDFGAFPPRPRSYQKGDLCRRRRWTRTRIIKPSQECVALSRVLPMVWELGAGENGHSIKARSHVKLHNHTGVHLSFFGFSHSWDRDSYIGNAAPGNSLSIPILLASATHLRLAILKKTHRDSSSIESFFRTERLMILPSGLTSNRIIRASILCEHRSNDDGFLSIKKLHFLLTLKCAMGIVDLHVDPALKVLNLLPCQCEIQLGEIGFSVVRKASRKIEQTEVLSLGAGKEGCCLSVDCHLGPHIAARLPGQ
ncbi:hypothetical protein ACHAWF_017551 [Thalassiosira exigua]